MIQAHPRRSEDKILLQQIGPAIVAAIFQIETTPATLVNIYTLAAHIYQSMQQMKHIVERKKDRKGATAEIKQEKKGKPDIQVTVRQLIAEEWKKHMKLWLCFCCHKIGHHAQDHNQDGLLKTGVVSRKSRGAPQTTTQMTPYKPKFK